MSEDPNPDLAALWGEIVRQERTYPGTMPGKLLTSLGEEFGEVCHAFGRDVPLLGEHGAIAELLQLAAVAMRGYSALMEQALADHLASAEDDDPRGDDGPYSYIADAYMRRP